MKEVSEGKTSWAWHLMPTLFLFVLGILPGTVIADFADPFYEGRQGVIEGVGTHFEIFDSAYLNITLDSSEQVELMLESVPEMITFNLNASGEPSEATFMISGLLPSTIYHKYEDSYENHVEFTADDLGSYSYAQDLTEPHTVFIQPRASTLFIRDDATGGDCNTIGIWDSVTKTCTLTTDVDETIEIASSGITLNGNSHRVVGTGTGNGVYLNRNGLATVENLTVEGFVYGIRFERSSSSTFRGNTIRSHTAYGLFGYDSSSTVVENNVFESGFDNGTLKNSQGPYGISISRLQIHPHNTVVRNNTLSGFNIGISLDENIDPIISDNIIADVSQLGILLSRAVNATILRNTMTGTGGFRIAGNTSSIKSDMWYEHTIDQSNTINGKVIYYDIDTNGKIYDGLRPEFSNIASIHCIRCTNSVFKNFSFGEQYQGMYLLRAVGSRVSDSVFADNLIGLRLEISTDNIIRNSVFNNNVFGITFDIDSDNNVFENNQIINNTAHGVNGFRSNGNVFRGNTFMNNFTPFTIGAPPGSIYFYRNNFFESLLRLGGNTNVGIFNLDLPIGGNYWQNHDEPAEGCNDINNDSICDTSYAVVSETSRYFAGIDYYPWTHPVVFEPEPEPEPEPEIDPLLVQYEPILLLHPEENYQPMNVEAFVGASSLWDDEGLFPDTPIKAESESDPVTLDDISVQDVSEDWYLQFSGGSVSPKTFSTTTALAKYQSLVDGGDAVPTYYGYKMEDSFVDDEGAVHEYIVLQYWYFYAFNDWLEHGGLNNHEGDWETVMVFLDKNTEGPKFVAYSAHLNDDDPSFNLAQYDSVRRSWNSNEVEKEGEQVKSYVAIGSHANYPNNGSNGEHIVQGIPLDHLDLTSPSGGIISSSLWSDKVPLTSNSPVWVSGYEGKWGADTTVVGSDGPQGPNFIAPILGGGVNRFNEPIEWAGIDKVNQKEVTTDTDALTFTNQSTVMYFEESVGPGTIISVSQHDEFISYGNNLDAIELLPHFWDLESNLGNNIPTTTVSFAYDAEEVRNLGVIEQDLAVFFYNEETNSWEAVVSLLDTQTSTVSFITNHFSRYAIGAKKWEYITDSVEIKRHWGKYDPKAGTREAYLDFSGVDLPETLRVLLPSLNGIYLLNNTGTTTEGVPFIDVTEDSSQFEAALLFSVPYKEIITGDDVTYVPDPLKFDFDVEIQKQLEP